VRILSPSTAGPRESHRAKLMLDEVFGEECILSEIIWAHDFGGRPKRRWRRG
jgi:site-specific DNA-methyltransferase (adenine-specific)